ncbi:hypothetical protein C8R47DRAFT_606699 [Mycena vitilis]|nr:hypothetical protein C8R47DRAFT_606699 [Mycena vitilis]
MVIQLARFVPGSGYEQWKCAKIGLSNWASWPSGNESLRLWETLRHEASVELLFFVALQYISSVISTFAWDRDTRASIINSTLQVALTFRSREPPLTFSIEPPPIMLPARWPIRVTTKMSQENLAAKFAPATSAISSGERDPLTSRLSLLHYADPSLRLKHGYICLGVGQRRPLCGALRFLRARTFLWACILVVRIEKGRDVSLLPGVLEKALKGEKVNGAETDTLRRRCQECRSTAHTFEIEHENSPLCYLPVTVLASGGSVWYRLTMQHLVFDC